MIYCSLSVLKCGAQIFFFYLFIFPLFSDCNSENNSLSAFGGYAHTLLCIYRGNHQNHLYWLLCTGMQGICLNDNYPGCFSDWDYRHAFGFSFPLHGELVVYRRYFVKKIRLFVPSVRLKESDNCVLAKCFIFFSINVY